MTRISVVLPACVAPSSTVTARGTSAGRAGTARSRRRPAARCARASAPCALRRSTRRCAAVGQCASHQRATRRALGRRQVQAELGAPPQHVVGAARPFVRRAGSRSSRLVQARARPAAPSAVAAEQRLDARAVGARQPVQQRRRPAPDGAARAPATKRSKSVSGRRGRADPGAQVAAGQQGAARSRRRAHRRAAPAEPVGRLLGELAEGRDLAAPDGEQRRLLRCRARAGSRASPPTGRRRRRRAAAARPSSSRPRLPACTARAK